MEQRKVMLVNSFQSLPPTTASVSMIVSALAVEVTTLIQFKNIPWFTHWFLHFPVSTANGRLEQCCVLNNSSRCTPQVSFDPQTQTISVGPCFPETTTLMFTIVTVYVPSFRQSFIGHLHMGSVRYPCATAISIRNMLPTPIKAQIRTCNGHIKSICNEDSLDSDFLQCNLLLADSHNIKVHIFLADNQYFGVDEPCCVANGNSFWVLSQKTDMLHDPHMWILKPPMRDISIARFYVGLARRLPYKLSLAEPQDLTASAAKIVCNREVFFQKISCITLESDIRSRISIADKLFTMELMDFDEDALLPWIEAAGFSWRTNLKITPHIARVINLLNLDE